MLYTSKNSDFIQSIFFFFIGEFDHLDLFQGVYFTISQSLNLIYRTVCSFSYIVKKKKL